MFLRLTCFYVSILVPYSVQVCCDYACIARASSYLLWRCQHLERYLFIGKESFETRRSSSVVFWVVHVWYVWGLTSSDTISVSPQGQGPEVRRNSQTCGPRVLELKGRSSRRISRAVLTAHGMSVTCSIVRKEAKGHKKRIRLLG